jgi:hypothetical protein
MFGVLKPKHIRNKYHDNNKKDNYREKLSKFLSYIVFQAEHIRIGLEITLCVLLYLFLQSAFPWSFFNVSSEWSTLFSWIAACGLLVYFDQSILCRPVYSLKKARSSDLAGKYDDALGELEKIAPHGSSLIAIPQNTYHLERARILTHATRFDAVEEELTSAKAAGIRDVDYHLARVEYLKASNNIDEALSELQNAWNLIGENPSVMAEEALLILEYKKDYRQAKSLLKKALGSFTFTTYQNDLSGLIYAGYYEVTRLWTGEAEEGIEGLSIVIDQLNSISTYNPEYRSYLASLLVERAYYLVTHQEPDQAVHDTKRANYLCAYPRIIKRTDEIKEELLGRFHIQLDT